MEFMITFFAYTTVMLVFGIFFKLAMKLEESKVTVETKK